MLPREAGLTILQVLPIDLFHINAVRNSALSANRGDL